jgi:germination protein M
MSRRQRGSCASCVLMVLLAAAVVVMGWLLWRIYPEYQRLREQEAARVEPASAPAPPEPRPAVATLYFARIIEGQQRLVAIDRELPAGMPPARAALDELIRGEVPRGCDRPLPRGTKLLDVRVAGDEASADFTEELVSEFRGGSDNEGVMVYAIVNTLSSLPDMKKVRILVEGEPVDTIGGHLDVSGPLSFDDELVVSYS